MASVKRVEHKSGRVVYRIVICMGYDKAGNKLVKNFTYSVNQSATPKQQEKEAIKYAMNMEDKIKYGHDFDSEKWIESMKDELAYSTYESYKNMLRKRLIPYFKGYRIGNIKTPLIENFYKTMVDTCAYGTIKKHANVLSGMFKTAIRWNIIEINPCQNAKIPKKENLDKEIKYFTPQQSLMFLKSLDLVYETVYKGHRRIDDTGKPYYVKDYTESHEVPTQLKVFYTLSLYCGFRKGETLAIHWDDIDFVKREISITKSVGKVENGVAYKNPKTATSIRTPYQFFKRHLKKYNKWVKENEVEAKMKGFEELPIIPLHGLRHSCATLLNYLNVNIIDIAKQLGHSKSSTTMDIYAHSFEEQNREIINKLDSYLAKQA